MSNKCCEGGCGDAVSTVDSMLRFSEELCPSFDVRIIFRVAVAVAVSG